MKIIFLDFDGVMNKNDTSDRVPHPFMKGRRVVGLEADIVKRVSALAVSAGAKVVISSTWRMFYKLDDLRALLLSYGWLPEAEIIGETPKDPPHRGPGLIIHGYDRGDEIQAWLTEHGTPEHFLVLDDLPTQFKDNHIQTNDSEGFTPQQVERAMQILGGMA